MCSDVLLIELECKHCKLRFNICRKCYRGHVYCSNSCRRQAQLKARRKVQSRYRTSDKGRATHRCYEKMPTLIKALSEALKDPEVDVRIRAVATLKDIGPEAKAAVPALTETLRDKDNRVRRSASLALGEIGPEAKPGVPALIEALKDENESVRRDAALALKKINTPEAQKATECCLSDQINLLKINEIDAKRGVK